MRSGFPFCRFLFAATVLLAGCGPAGGARGPVCFDDGHPDGPPCLERIETEAEFERVAYQAIATKFMLPVSDDPDLLPLVFQNSNRYRLHFDFLREAFPQRFGDLTTSDYLRLIYRRATRSYFSGVIQRVDTAIAGRIYGFDAWADPADPSEQLEMKEVRAIYDVIHQAFLPEKVAYLPTDPQAVSKARSWIDPDFPVYLGWDEVNTEVYTPGVGYGRVRRYTLEELEMVTRQGGLSWQDILVVDRVPFDIESVVAGVVTGGRQWELSHVNVRMARRGTPNLYLKNALSKLEEFDGRLVRLEAEKASFAGSDDRYRISEVTQEEAEAWWAAHRPNLGDAPVIDRDYRSLDNLLEMDTDDDPLPLVSRFGGKAANLAKLYLFLPPGYQVSGFAIPFAYFEDFMESNLLLDRRSDPPEEVSYRVYLSRLVVDQRFRTDVLYRRELLWDLRTRMCWEAAIDPGLVADLVQRVREVFGGTRAKVRFRSSSNVEDALQFSGAGLYHSTSVCVDDSLDADRDGPSRCDLSQEEEHTVERGLTKVWASLYNDRAWEEREWYQVPQEQASMAILVTPAFSGERANGVAFTGNTARSNDDRYLINVQLGDEPVVGNDPHIVPEMDLLTVEPSSGEVTKIYRSRTSVLSEPGSYVLSDSQLGELGGLMAAIDRDYPLDTGGFPREQVLLDLEFKIDREADLRIKQIRPFLDRCRQVVCNQPPPNVCLDQNTLLKYQATGSCDAVTGGCRYATSQVLCQNGCLDGSCSG